MCLVLTVLCCHAVLCFAFGETIRYLKSNSPSNLSDLIYQIHQSLYPLILFYNPIQPFTQSIQFIQFNPFVHLSVMAIGKFCICICICICIYIYISILYLYLYLYLICICQEWQTLYFGSSPVSSVPFPATPIQVKRNIRLS